MTRIAHAFSMVILLSFRMIAPGLLWQYVQTTARGPVTFAFSVQLRLWLALLFAVLNPVHAVHKAIARAFWADPSNGQPSCGALKELYVVSNHMALCDGHRGARGGCLLGASWCKHIQAVVGQLSVAKA